MGGSAGLHRCRSGFRGRVRSHTVADDPARDFSHSGIVNQAELNQATFGTIFDSGRLASATHLRA